MGDITDEIAIKQMGGTCDALTSQCYTLKENASMRVAFIHPHGHLLATEMYQKLIRSGVEYNLGSVLPWTFHDQAVMDLMPMNLTVQVGDVIQATCVYNSTSQTTETPFGPSSYNEMCTPYIALLRGPTTQKGYWTFGCHGNAWMGQMAHDEDGYMAPQLHPESQAADVFRVSPDGYIVQTGLPQVSNLLQVSNAAKLAHIGILDIWVVV